MSLSGATQRWFVSLDISRHPRTWDDLAQEFLRQFAVNTIIDVSRKELKALRQKSEKSVTSFISRWREKISQALYGIEEGIARELWFESSPSDSKGKKPLVGQRPGDVGVIDKAWLRPPRRYQKVGHVIESGSSKAYRGRIVDGFSLLDHHFSLFRLSSGWIYTGVVHLGHPSVTTNPLPTHTTHLVPPPTDSRHSIDFAELDDHIHMLNVDEVQTPFVDISQTPYVDNAHLQMCNMLSTGVEWFDSSPPQPLDPWRGRHPKRRPGGRKMRF
ncbi:hypothetical protein CK203_051271 [Vitis vinifera]|uniref:Retrotransposon gag domain-containing protein n=1 Tax=Vitis vinifera TaxID=29760 RepID=A0A438H7V3_VITVI|nr:hypothetical protein CK203_051271 [Vitis vinifera]